MVALSFRVADNVLHIAEGGEYEAQTFKIIQMFNRSTSAAILLIPC